MTKRLYRSSRSKILGGVCGGLGDYFDIDPTLIRLFAVLALFFSDGAVFVAYIVAWIIMPLRLPGAEPSQPSEAPSGPQAAAAGVDDPMWHSFLPGVILIALGGLLLLRQYFYWWNLGDFWPVVLILLGVGLIVFKGTRRNGVEASNGTVNSHPMNEQNGGGAV